MNDRATRGRENSSGKEDLIDRNIKKSKLNRDEIIPDADQSTKETTEATEKKTTWADKVKTIMNPLEPTTIPGLYWDKLIQGDTEMELPPDEIIQMVIHDYDHEDWKENSKEGSAPFNQAEEGDYRHALLEEPWQMVDHYLLVQSQEILATYHSQLSQIGFWAQQKFTSGTGSRYEVLEQEDPQIQGPNTHRTNEPTPLSNAQTSYLKNKKRFFQKSQELTRIKERGTRRVLIQIREHPTQLKKLLCNLRLKVVVPSSQIYYPTKEKVDMANRIHRNVVKAILATDPPDPGAGMSTTSNKIELIFSNNRDDAVNMMVDQNFSGVHT
ncbi:uncharacterized protein LOC130980617 [Arachis stenosperma]|uniref:uncharacterized protein LOC130980617 n=1 Tax=Arachis stenosperma TaxID=217475 RepID=UPI0025ABEDEC|nr:uncharacterized protein LOC130980617 [Arachis stenosperma]